MSAITCSRYLASPTRASTSSMSPSGPQSACRKRRAGSWGWSKARAVRRHYAIRSVESALSTLSFEVAEFSPGLEGVVAAETVVSEVAGPNGRLNYRGGNPSQRPAPDRPYQGDRYLAAAGDSAA